VFPGVRVDVANRIVEFDAEVTPNLVKDPQAPMFFLEVLACIPDTREHETLVVSKARPSHIHAALLLIGLNPGQPGGWTFENQTLHGVPPTGDRVDVRFSYADPSGKIIEAAPTDWVVSARDGSAFVSPGSKEGWVFAGSRFITGPDGTQIYDADGAGTILGLTTFGNEVIAWSRVFSPDSEVEAPEWVARMDAVPPAGTRITVRIVTAK
jgi:hypothetical protein